jgi:hypothetical protein
MSVIVAGDSVDKDECVDIVKPEDVQTSIDGCEREDGVIAASNEENAEPDSLSMIVMTLHSDSDEEESDHMEDGDESVAQTGDEHDPEHGQNGDGENVTQSNDETVDNQNEANNECKSDAFLDDCSTISDSLSSKLSLDGKSSDRGGSMSGSGDKRVTKKETVKPKFSRGIVMSKTASSAAKAKPVSQSSDMPTTTPKKKPPIPVQSTGSARKLMQSDSVDKAGSDTFVSHAELANSWHASLRSDDPLIKRSEKRGSSNSITSGYGGSGNSSSNAREKSRDFQKAAMLKAMRDDTKSLLADGRPSLTTMTAQVSFPHKIMIAVFILTDQYCTVY